MRTITLSILAALISLAIAGCNASDNTGTVELNLVGRAPSGTTYRLRAAVITVQGPSTTQIWYTEEHLVDTQLSANVPPGDYTAFLQGDWRLERVDALGIGTPVESALLSANPLAFVVAPGIQTRVALRFRVGDDVIEFDEGYDIVIDVEEPVTTGAVCSADADCQPGQTCCNGGFLGTCQNVAPGDVCPLPDLTVDAEAALQSMYISRRNFPANDCALVEECVAGPGDRRLLNFSTRTPNIGEVDMVLGDPTTVPGFEFSACHSHYHFVGYARYQLLDAADAVVATGHKQAFCLLDLDGPPGSVPRYSCNFQGISAGWADIYGAGLDCQWVDITDVAAGDYRLRITINEDQTLPEANYANNMIEVPVTIPEDVPPVPGDPLAACPGTEGGGRDCGWQIAAGQQALTCTPGESVAVGCGCDFGGVCVNDPVLRVCEGDGACLLANAIASDDDGGSCGLCPQTSFVCPASGVYTVLTGGFTAGTAYTCELPPAP